MDKLPCWANAKFLCFIIVVMRRRVEAESDKSRPLRAHNGDDDSTFHCPPEEEKRSSEKWLWRRWISLHVGTAFRINCQVFLALYFVSDLIDVWGILIASHRLRFSSIKRHFIFLKNRFSFPGSAARRKKVWKYGSRETLFPPFLAFIDFSSAQKSDPRTGLNLVVSRLCE